MAANQRGPAAVLVHRQAVEPSLSSSSWNAALWPRVQWGVVPVEKGRLRAVRRPGQSQHLFSSPRREFQGDSARADLCELFTRRGPLLRGLPRAGQPRGDARRFPHAARVDPPAEHAPAAALRPCRERRRRPPRLGVHYPADIQLIFDAKCTKCRRRGTGSRAELTGEVTAVLQHLVRRVGQEGIGRADHRRVHPYLVSSRAIRATTTAYLPPRRLGCPQAR